MKLQLIIYFFSFSTLFISLNAKEESSTESVMEFSLHDRFFWENGLESWWWPWENDKETQPKVNDPFSYSKIIGLEKKLKDKIVGQDDAIKQTVASLERYAYGLNDLHAPIATLLYIGPSGVGKSQLAKELAINLFGSENSLIQLNMADYQHENAAADLLGSPVGYRDHEKGGRLANALKKQPFAIVLLDEIEKAHPAVFKLLLPLFDHGIIYDKQGTLIDCRNMVFILTSNLESQKILTMDDLGSTIDEIGDAIRPALMKHLSPEFYNRLQTVIFRGLKEIIKDQLAKVLLKQSIAEIKNKIGVSFQFKQSIIDFFKAKCIHSSLGARPLKQFIQKSLIGAIVEAIKQGYLQRGDRATVGFIDHSFVITNSQKFHSFKWLWKEEQAQFKPPFNFENLLGLEVRLQSKILGQPYAIQATVASLVRYAAGLGSDKTPIGALLYVGPTGVGKTQLAKELAIELMGSEERLIRLDMAEYNLEHSLTRLIGSPPGYINHEEGGQLTEALKKDPYAIVLLDEIEKAHPAILKAFLSIFDEGRISDASGTLIDCRNVIFIATTNLAAAKILFLNDKGYPVEEILSHIQPEIIRAISPELFNRLEVAPFMGLAPELLDELVCNLLNELKRELQKKKGIAIRFDSTLIEFLKVEGYGKELGARPLKRLIRQLVTTQIAREILSKNIQTGDEITLFYNGKSLEFEKIGNL